MTETQNITEIRSDLVLLELLKECYTIDKYFYIDGLCYVLAEMNNDFVITYDEHDRLIDIIRDNRPKFSFHNIFSMYWNSNLKKGVGYWWHKSDSGPRKRYIDRLVKRAKANKLIRDSE